MHVTFLSTYPPTHCGIGEYTKHLVDALRRVDPALSIGLATEGDIEPSAADVGDVAITARRAFSRDEDYVERAISVVRSLDSDLVHLQHAPDIFGEDARVLRLVDALHDANVRVVVTPHTVHRDSHGRASPHQVELLSRADAVVAHQRESMANVLGASGIDSSRIHVIPHGTTRLVLPPCSDARRRLGISEGATTLLFFGFIHRGKNCHTALRAFLRVAPQAPDSLLIFAGAPGGGRWYNRLYLEMLRRGAALSRARDLVRFDSEYISEASMRDLFSACDVVLLPHHQRYGSASGVLHLALGAGKAVLFTDGPKFENIKEILTEVPECIVPSGGLDDWTAALRRVMTSGEVRQRCRDAARDFADRTAWPHVAAQHLEVYRGLARRPS